MLRRSHTASRSPWAHAAQDSRVVPFNDGLVSRPRSSHKNNSRFALQDMGCEFGQFSFVRTPRTPKRVRATKRSPKVLLPAVFLSCSLRTLDLLRKCGNFLFESSIDTGQMKRNGPQINTWPKPWQDVNLGDIWFRLLFPAGVS